MTYFAYLDEFGHVGPYVSRADPRHNASPVFGLAGYVLPAAQVRGFGTWFFQRKCQLLDRNIRRSGKYPAQWEMKGASLFTARSVRKYPRVRGIAHRLLNKIDRQGGFVFYVGVMKTGPLDSHRPNQLYTRVLLEAIKRIDQFCALNCNPPEDFVLVLDEHTLRPALITAVSMSMYGRREGRRRHLIEPLFHVESERYQTIQAADWIAALIGRLGALRADPAGFPENLVFRQHFEADIERISRQSGIRA